MFRRSLLLFLMGLSVSTLAGCDRLKQMLRSSDHATKADAAEDADPTSPTKIQAVDADAKNPKPFFSKGYSSGGLSKEAREIESHLGVGP
ncbi:hypothetical protein OJF2_68910 [Aquisphaera giovannonii]|uniref:Lipoprotein n=1 Tax=Aquisphaera giovannonii TaxID=406548 RepID=A0A5B9WCS1_9BACT|nr:hypothetical protein [Aquisphaera giovannonii]QEH38293.1 hypothetical protein OJF2_68910 [Aquisphaera giovannonii]